MKLLDFIKNLIPSFGSKAILQQLDATHQGLSQLVIPSVESAASSLGSIRFTNKSTQAFDSYAKKHLKVKYSGNYINGILVVLKQLGENIPVVRKTVEQSFAADVTKESLNIVRTTLLQHVETIDFVATYTTRLITYTMNQESLAKVKNANDNVVFVRVTPAELEYVSDNFESYIAALNALFNKKDELERGLRGLPAINVNENNVENIETIAGIDKTDPFGFAKIGPLPNPFFVVATRIAERQDRRYRIVKEEVTRLNFQIRGWEVQSSKEGVSEEEKANLQRFITHTQSRVCDLQDELEDLEK